MPYRKTAPETIVTVAASSTLATLLGSALSVHTDYVILRPFATGIYYNDGGAASASTTPLGTSDWGRPMKPGDLDTYQFYASNVKMSVWQGRYTAD